MANTKALNFVVVFILVVSLPFVQSSASSRIHRTNMEGIRVSTETNIEVARFGNEGGIVEDSAREVPTGPDPLHHNNHPIGH